MSRKGITLLGATILLVVSACDRPEPVAPGAALLDQPSASVKSGGTDPGLAALLAVNRAARRPGIEPPGRGHRVFLDRQWSAQ